MACQLVPANRLVDYFIVVGTGPRLIPIDESNAPPDDGPSPSGTGLPAAPRTYMDRLYRGSVLSRFPSIEHASVPFPDSITIFVIPESISLTHSQSELPILYYFAATQGNGVRLYGACLRFHELVPPEAVDQLEEQERQSRTAAASTTESAGERESNPLSRLHGDLHNEDAEHSYSTGEHGLAQKKLRSRSSSPTHLTVHVQDSSTSPSASPTATTVVLTPPRPARSGISLDSFAPILPAHRSNTVVTRAPQLARVASSSVAVAPRTAAATKVKPVYAPKCLCILSLHPYLEQYRVFLTELYRISLTPTRIPLERFISNFVLEIPLPPPTGDLKLRYSISNQLLEFARAPANKPLTYMHSTSKNRASRILTLFELLDLDNILFVFECILLEKRILFLSSRLSLLTMVAEIFLHLLFPFQWAHVYIPLLPKALIDFLFAPMPFIIGMHHEYVRGHLHGEMLIDLVVVDLDKNKVHYSNHPHHPTHQQSPAASPYRPSSQAGDPSGAHTHHFLPSKERKKLKLKLRPFQALFSRTPGTGVYVSAKDGSGKLNDASLRVEKPPHQAYQLRMLSELDLAFPNAPHPDELESIEQYAQLVTELQGQEEEISLAFFRCFVSMFQHYREFLIYPTAENPEPDPPFRWKEFLKKTGVSLSNGNQSGEVVEEFFTAFAKTQAWQKFCEERIYAAPIGGGGGPASPGGVVSPTSSSSPAASLTPASAALLSREALSILFFDESIVAKRNRSMFSSLTKKSQTPFLDLPVLEQKVVVIPGPEECGLPPPVEVTPGSSALSPPSASGAGISGCGATGLSASKRTKPFQFSYSTFPDVLDESLFWGERILPPQKQIKQVGGAAAGANAIGGGAGVGVVGGHERRRSVGQSGVLQPSAACAAAAAARPVDSTAVLEAVWFTLLASMASSFRSPPLLKVGLARLHERVERVIAAREEAGLNWKTADGLPQPPPEDVFLRMMRACGACSLPELATDIFQTLLLRLEEYRVLEDRAAPQTAAMYTLLLSIHSMNNDHRGLEGLTKLKKQPSGSQPGGATPIASPNPALKAISVLSPVDVEFPESPSSPVGAASGKSTATSALAMTTPSRANTQSPSYPSGPIFHPSPRAGWSPRAPDTADDMSVPALPALAVFDSDAARDSKTPKRPGAIATGATPSNGAKHVVQRDLEEELGDLLVDPQSAKKVQMDPAQRLAFYQSQFKQNFPSLAVDVMDSCPECEKPLTDGDIRSGWSSTKENDYTTQCPHCKERFVARFTVRPLGGASSPSHPAPLSPSSGAASSSSTISCEYLPPLVLRKEVTRVLDAHSLNPTPSSPIVSFQSSSPSLFWNLVWHLAGLRLPVDFIVAPERYVEPPTPSRRKIAQPAKRSKPTGTSSAMTQAASSVPLATLMAAAKSQLPVSMATSTAAAGLAVAVPFSTPGTPLPSEPLLIDEEDEDVSASGAPGGGSLSLVSEHSMSRTTNEEDDLAAELGADWTSELPNSPGGALSPDALSPSDQAAAMREQFRADQIQAALSGSGSRAHSVSSENRFDFEPSTMPLA